MNDMMMSEHERHQTASAAAEAAIIRLTEAGYQAWYGSEGEGAPHVAIDPGDAGLIIGELAALREQPSLTLVVTQDRETIARISNYRGPVPQVGSYIFHPALSDEGGEDITATNRGIAGCVRVVTYGLYARPRNGEGHFTARSRYYVEVTI